MFRVAQCWYLTTRFLYRLQDGCSLRQVLDETIHGYGNHESAFHWGGVHRFYCCRVGLERNGKVLWQGSALRNPFFLFIFFHPLILIQGWPGFYVRVVTSLTQCF